MKHPDKVNAHSGKVKAMLLKTIDEISADPSKYAVNPDDPDTFFEPNEKSKRGFNQIHVNAFYSILDRRFTNLVIQPGRKRNEYSDAKRPPQHVTGTFDPYR